MKKAIFLYDYTGIMAKPWIEDGYECWCFDGQHKPGIERDGLHVKVGMWFDAHRTDEHVDQIKSMVGDGVVFVFGFPECTYLSCSGARWLYHPDDKAIPVNQRRPHPAHPNRKKLRADAVILAKMVELVGIKFGCRWALENPTSQLSSLFRKPDFRFNPCDFGWYLPPDDVNPIYPEIYPGQDAYNKETSIWCGNGFVEPMKNPVLPLHKDNPGWKKCGGKSLKTKNIRSATPRGFAKAVFLANKE